MSDHNNRASIAPVVRRLTARPDRFGRGRGVAYGVSTLALLAAGLVATQAAAQTAVPVRPGGAQCPVVDRVVTCTGDIRNGVTVPYNVPVRELNVRDLTAPITPRAATSAIRLEGYSGETYDQTINVDASARITATLISSQGAIQASGSNVRNVTIDTAAAITATGTGAGIYVENARAASITNRGVISVTGTRPGTNAIAAGINASNVATMTIINEGTIAVPVGAAVALNYERRSQTAMPPTSLTVVNRGTLDGTDPTTAFNEFARVVNVGTSGNAIVDITNSGTIRNGVVSIDHNTLPSTQFSATITNTGALLGGIDINVGKSPEVGFVDNLPGYGDVRFDITNSGTITVAPVAVNNTPFYGISIYGLEVNSSVITINNSGAITGVIGRGGAITGGLGGNIDQGQVNTMSLKNTADIDLTGVNEISGFTVGAGGDTTIINSGAIRLKGTETRAIDVKSGQSGLDTECTNAEFIDSLNVGLAYCSTIFTRHSSVTTLANSGDVTGTAARFAFGLRSFSYGRATLLNDGDITLGIVNEARINGGPRMIGLELDAFMGGSIVNNGAIDLGASHYGAGIFFYEQSEPDQPIKFLGQIDAPDPFYDRAADLRSRIDVLTTNNISARGPGSFAIYGLQGAADQSDAKLNISYFNPLAASAITIGTAATVTGGTARGSGIYLAGAGTTTIVNGGAVIGLGDLGTAAILVGGTEFPYFDAPPSEFKDRMNPFAPGFGMDIASLTNAGTIRSANGYGVWAQSGGIASLVNRGTIMGGEASVGAIEAATIINEAGGTLDGRIALGSATGSSVTNAGRITVSTPGFVTHEIAGSYTQSATGSLDLRSGVDGADRFNVTGNLSLGGDLNLALGPPSPTALFTVGGNLTLDARLNVANNGGFGAGVYRLFDYAGTLGGGGLTLGALPDGAMGSFQTVFAGQVNLVVGSVPTQFWDGAGTVADLAIAGGTGTWDLTRTNWTRTNGDINENWQSGFAVFQGAPGTVTVVDGGVTAAGLQFAVDGYRVAGGPITLVTPSTLRVGDGSAGGAGYRATIASPIAGAGGIDKTDLGTLTLTGVNSYTGGTRVSGGTLIGDTGSIRGDITIAAGARMVFDQSGAGSFANAIAGSGSLEKAGSGGVTLTGNNGAFLGSTTVSAGTLTVDGALGGTVQVAGGTLAGSGSADATSIADGATLAPGGAGVGKLTLASLNLSAGSRLAFGLAAPGVVGGTVSDLVRVTGNLVLDGTLDVTALPGFGEGVYRLFDYGGAVTDNGLALGSVPGAAQVQTILPGQVNLVVGSALQYWDGAGTVADLRVDGGAGTWNNTITNWTRVAGDVNESWSRGFAVFQGTPGTVTIAPDGVAATGLQFAVDGYRVEGGTLTLNAPATLRVGDGSTAGAGYTATIASSIAGSGEVFKTDLGTLILTGANSYTGGTSVNSGVLQVASDANLGAASGGVTLDGGSLRQAGALNSARGFTIGAGGGTLDTQANTATLSGTLGGTGVFTKTGGGTLAYSGIGAAFAGATRIAAGTLALSGTLGGPVSIASGATLAGTGRVASLDLSGTVAPGNSPGTLSITGDAVFRAGSTYQVELAASGATDLIRVGGVAVIQGGSVAITQLDARSAYIDGAVFRILDAAGGRTGTFAGVTRNSLLFGFTLGYDPTGAFVTARQVSTTYNQGQAAVGLEAFDRTVGSDGAGVFAALLALDTDPLRAALDATSGEIYAGLLADTLGSGMARADRLVARANTPAPEGWGLWGGLDGGTGRIDGDGNAARLDHSGYGLDLGIDYRGAGNTWAFGAGGGYTHASLDLDARSSRSRSNGWQLGGYARYGTGGAGLTASASATYERHKADISRAIAFAGIGRGADGRADVEGTAVTGELRYGLAVAGGWSLGPVASVHYAHASIENIRETGSATLALSGRGDDNRTRYGGGAFVTWQSGRSAIDLSTQYVGGDSTTSNVALTFAGAPATAFDIRSPRIRADAALVDLGTRYDFGGGWSMAGTARATIARDQRTVSGNATLAWRF